MKDCVRHNVALELKYLTGHEEREKEREGERERERGREREGEKGNSSRK